VDNDEVLEVRAICDALKGIRSTLAWVCFWLFLIAYQMCSWGMQDFLGKAGDALFEKTEDALGD